MHLSGIMCVRLGFFRATGTLLTGGRPWMILPLCSPSRTQGAVPSGTTPASKNISKRGHKKPDPAGGNKQSEGVAGTGDPPVRRLAVGGFGHHALV